MNTIYYSSNVRKTQHLQKLKNPRNLSCILCCLGTFMCMAFCGTAQAEDCIGKIEAGPTYLHLDILESGKTIKKVNMPAIRIDGSGMVWKGICVKPSFLYGGKGNTQTLSCGLGAGLVYKPIECLCITPSIGCSYAQFRTTLRVNVPENVRIALNLPENMRVDVREKFYSISPYGSIDITYTIVKGLRICGIFQYVWSDTHTTIKGSGSTTSHPKGQNYALILEKDINERWSINIAGAYNDSLTKEKHGVRAYGARIAAAYWY